MNKLDDVKLSKYLSLILRYKPDLIGLKLDENGWAIIVELIAKINLQNVNISENDLRFIVEISDKKRFEFSNDNLKIRASQGHSINIDLQLTSSEPPNLLYHGTAEKT